MPSAPLTPAEKLKEFSLRLNEAVEADSANWRLPAWLVALIVGFIKEIVEAFAELAKLLREGKLPLHPSAPRQGASRPAGSPKKRVPTARQACFPLPDPEMAEPEMAEPPATAPGPAQPTQSLGVTPEAERPAAPIPPAPQPWKPATTATERHRRGSIPLASGPPAQFAAWDKHLSWHAHNVTI